MGFGDLRDLRGGVHYWTTELRPNRCYEPLSLLLKSGFKVLMLRARLILR
jgi:hypothetical protein